VQQQPDVASRRGRNGQPPVCRSNTNEGVSYCKCWGSLLGATAQGRIIFTFNVRDFMLLATRHPRHGGIVLAAQSSWRLGDLAAAVDRLLAETDATDWPGRVEWLSRWR
jgi:hypothetical protein